MFTEFQNSLTQDIMLIRYWDTWQNRKGVDHLHEVEEIHLNLKFLQNYDKDDNAMNIDLFYSYTFDPNKIIKLKESTIGY